MASSSGRNQNVKLLVADKKVMESERKWNKPYPGEGIYFIDNTDCFNEVLFKMSNICKKPVSRIYYIDSDNDEVPIDSEVEFKEALKLIGDRTERGKFTPMKIETESTQNLKKKEKMKKTKVKVAAKVSEPSLAAKKPTTPTPQKVASEIRPLRVMREYTPKFGKSEISKTWLEKHLKQLKLEIMSDLERLLEPYLKEQQKMSALISSLTSTHLEEREFTTHSKKESELDHNYSAPSCSKISQGTKAHEKTFDESVDTMPQNDDYVSLKKNQNEMVHDTCTTCTTTCVCRYDDDENLSIRSGEISVTESESEEDGEDFVDVPLPSCFDVIAPQGGAGLSSAKLEHNRKLVKGLKAEAPAKIRGEEAKRQQKSNAKQNMSATVMEENKYTKQNCREMLKTNLAYTTGWARKSISYPSLYADFANDAEFIEGHDDFDDFEDDFEEDFVDFGDEDAQDLHGENHEKYDGEFNDEYTQKGDLQSSLSSTFQQTLHDQPDMHTQLPEQLSKQQIYETQNGTPLVGKTLNHQYPEEDALPPRQYGEEYSTPSVVYTKPQQASVDKPVQPFPTAQSHQDVVNAQQSVFIMANGLKQNSLVQECAQLPKPVMHQTQHVYHQPPAKVQNATSKISQDLTPETIVAQHQQIVQAAHRAAHEAQQTQALALNQPQNSAQIQQHQQQSNIQNGLSNTACQENLSQSNFYEDKTLAPSKHNQRINGPTNSFNQAVAMPMQMQETVQEVKLWNEVDAVDLELRKWVEMCQQLVEQIPRRIDESSLNMPERLNKLAVSAVKTHRDLEGVYQTFRREVQEISTQIDAQKQQKKAAGKAPPMAEDPILILPEKLMKIISSTLNTTFNILSNLSKLGMINAPCSEPSEQSSTLSALEKPQPQISTAFQKPNPQASAAIEKPHFQASAAMEKPQPQVSACLEKPKPKPHVSVAATKPQPLVSAIIPPMTNVRTNHASQTIPHSYYIPPMTAYGHQIPNEPQHVSNGGVVTEAEPPLSYRMRPVAPSTHGPNYQMVWGQNVSQAPTKPSLQVQPQTAPFQSQMQSQMQAQLMQSAFQQQLQQQFPHPVLATITLQRPMLQHQQTPYQPQMQLITRDDASGRQVAENNRTDHTYSGILLNDYSSIAPDMQNSSNMTPLFTSRRPDTQNSSNMTTLYNNRTQRQQKHRGRMKN